MHILKALSLLGLDRLPDEQELKNAYREAAKFFHPDRNGGNKISSQAFIEVIEACELLRSKRYDSDLNVVPVTVDPKTFIDGRFTVSCSDVLPCGCRGGYTSPTSICERCNGSGILESQSEKTVDIDECSLSQLNDSIVAEYDCDFYLLVPQKGCDLSIEDDTLVLNAIVAATQKDFAIDKSVIYSPLSLNLGKSYEDSNVSSFVLSARRILNISIRLSIAV